MMTHTLGGQLFEAGAIVFRSMWGYFVLFAVVAVVKKIIKRRTDLR